MVTAIRLVLTSFSFVFRNDYGSTHTPSSTREAGLQRRRKQTAYTKVNPLIHLTFYTIIDSVPEHCFDFLRQSIMCLADVGIITYQWSPTRLVPIANSTTHQCANWKKLDDWTKKRTIDMMKPGWLIHPSKGMLSLSVHLISGANLDRLRVQGGRRRRVSPPLIKHIKMRTVVF